MVTITCKIPPDVDAELEAEATERRISKSAIVREALAARARRSSRTRRRRPTAYDLAKAACGAVEGPGDLSTNPKYLEGFGA